MTTMKEMIETYVHNYGQYYSTREECIENMKLLFYAPPETQWAIDPEMLVSEGHTPIPENKWATYDNSPCATFLEEDNAEGKVYVKHMFHLNV
jgi:hypothetical protein